MRVLHLDTATGYRGGQRQLRLLAAAQGNGTRVAPLVLACSPRLREELAAAEVPTRAWAGPVSITGLNQLREALWAGADIVHVHDSRAHGAVIAVAPRSVAKLVVHRRIDDVPSDRVVTRFKYRRGRFVCVSNAVAAVLRAAGVDDDRIDVVPSAVVPPERAPVRGPPGHPLRLLALGALVPHKGHDDLLAAIARVNSPLRLTLAGAGPLAQQLTDRVAELGLRDRVELIGDVGEGSDLFAQADLFVQPSRTEGLSTAVLDALACCLPVLATSAGGLPEAVGPGGWLVPPGQPEALAAQLASLARLAHEEPEQFARPGRLGREHVVAHHGLASMVRGMDAVYDSVHGRRRSPRH